MTAVIDRHLSDVAIIEASRHDADRFGLLYDRYCAMLYRYAYRRLGPSGSAEDVVADAFVVAFRKRGGYDLTKVDARPWLFGILTREIARRRRSEEARYRAIGRAGSCNELAWVFRRGWARTRTSTSSPTGWSPRWPHRRCAAS